MGKVYLIDNERRKNNSDIRPLEIKESEGGERRVQKVYMEKKKLEDLLAFLNERYNRLNEHVLDKEKKKLLIIASSFTVFTFLVTVGLGVLKDGITGIPTPLLLGVSSIFLAGIATINTSIIKYIVTFKLSWILALRQMNCIRQAINSVLFAKIEGFIPRRLTEEIMREKDFKDTILDSSSTYWNLYGRHEKYPLNNVHLRQKYSSRFKIWFTSSDFFAILTIVVFTIFLVMTPPILYSHYHGIEFNINSIGFIFFSGIVAATSMYLVFRSALSALDNINKTLSEDETFKIKNEREI